MQVSSMYVFLPEGRRVRIRIRGKGSLLHIFCDEVCHRVRYRGSHGCAKGKIDLGMLSKWLEAKLEEGYNLGWGEATMVSKGGVSC